MVLCKLSADLCQSTSAFTCSAACGSRPDPVQGYELQSDLAAFGLLHSGPLESRDYQSYKLHGSFATRMHICWDSSLESSTYFL